MARMYSRKRGQAGSTRPTKKAIPTWVRFKKTELEMVVSKLAKEGNAPSKIGLILRDKYGIPNVKLILGVSLTAYLREKELYKGLPEDLLAVIRKAIAVMKHNEKNTKDMTSKRGLQITESKIAKLTKYYKRTGALESKWKYNPEQARMYVE